LSFVFLFVCLFEPFFLFFFLSPFIYNTKKKNQTLCSTLSTFEKVEQNNFS
jgi:hypothetical protein